MRRATSTGPSHHIGICIAAMLAGLTVTSVAAQENMQSDTGVERQEMAPPKDPRISNQVVVFSGIDKITGRIITFDVYINETLQFGALQVTPRVCYSRDETQPPKTTTFVEVDEITLDRKIRRIFTGWMFADSPGLNAVDHAVYDVWLKDCATESDVPPPESSSS